MGVSGATIQRNPVYRLLFWLLEKVVTLIAGFEPGAPENLIGQNGKKCFRSST